MYTSIPVHIPPVQQRRDRKKEYSKVQLEKRMKEERQARNLCCLKKRKWRKERKAKRCPPTQAGAAPRMLSNLKTAFPEIEDSESRSGSSPRFRPAKGIGHHSPHTKQRGMGNEWLRKATQADSIQNT
ncbi:hypothetical protein K438DRAFT_1786504 [Mycena galopus ATCC 62051]|nr:hypothetical protein K438DRAFT_1786504 [Mycena galopus ATCC 62051]